MYPVCCCMEKCWKMRPMTEAKNNIYQSKCFHMSNGALQKATVASQTPKWTLEYENQWLCLIIQQFLLWNFLFYIFVRSVVSGLVCTGELCCNVHMYDAVSIRSAMHILSEYGNYLSLSLFKARFTCFNVC